ncbi:aspartyl protease family protein [Dyella sp. BiH032]|uniref:aspartyl protease family protein n=1 Tax=Dyella sp. BiH032 TaxID=3075430 RepID=UPI002892F30E|nr:aspartyl protease family protein [Dyella sp. BiH032]WNL46643.1 aspartyl protease family protein [Dyella sp. BiH032]
MIQPRTLPLLIAALLLPALACADDADTLLRELRQAHGADALHRHAAIDAEGSQQADGLEGRWQQTVDLRGGQYATRMRNELFAVADGYDAKGRWRQDNTGLVHDLNSPEARTVAASENWLRRLGFLDANDGTRYRLLPQADEEGHRFERLEATPTGGRAVTLWIDPATHRLDHATWQSSFLQITQRYGDYRAVDGATLPFRIVDKATTAAGGSDSENVATVTRYRWIDGTPAGLLQRPDGKVRDVTMAGDARRATVPMHLEGGFLLVDVSIDGKGPLPFILDTGGHAILTADAANKLGFETRGAGVSTGSGPGSMSTAYTRVGHLGLGAADVRDLTFLVMPYPHEFYERGEGREPIAGILGLEIFERFAVTFDYDKGQLVLQPYDHGDAPAAERGERLPLMFTDDMPLVDASLDGRRGTFGIDTGNSGLTLLFPQWAARQGIAARYKKGAPSPTGGVGGLFTAHFAHATSMQLGGQRLDNIVAMLTRADAGATGNPSEAGNIGQDVLSRFNVHFDYRRGEMVLQPRAQPAERQYAMAGFRAGKSAAQTDRYKVNWVLPGGPAAEAGLKAGDFIVAVNGKPAKAIGLGELRSASMGLPEATPLELTLDNGKVLKMRLRDVAPR